VQHHDTVVVTRETVWHQQKTGNFIPRYDKRLSFGRDYNRLNLCSLLPCSSFFCSGRLYPMQLS
jgi:hypothetical protein